MTLEQIIALLLGIAPQARKDGLEQIARAIMLTAHTEDEIKAATTKMTAESINSFIQEWRKNADSEITKATQTAEKNLRDKYDFVDKKDPKDPPKDPPTDLTPEAVQKMIQDAVKAATDALNKEVTGFKAEQQTAARRDILQKAFAENVPAAYKDAVLAGFEGRTFADDAAFNTYVEKVKTDTAAFMQDLADRGLREHDKPAFGAVNDKTGVSNAVEDFIKAKAEEAKPESQVGKAL